MEGLLTMIILSLVVSNKQQINRKKPKNQTEYLKIDNS